MRTAHTIEAGHPAARVLAYMREHKTRLVPRSIAARLLNIPPRMVDDALQEGIAAGLLVAIQDPSVGLAWQAGSNADMPVAAAPPRPPAVAPAPPADAHAAAAAAAAAAKQAKPSERRGGKRVRLPALDVAALTVTTGVPLPQRIAMKGATAHDALFVKLRLPGQALTGIPRAYQAALLKAAQTYCKTHVGVVLKVRSIPSTDTCGVWRLADTTGPA